MVKDEAFGEEEEEIPSLDGEVVRLTLGGVIFTRFPGDFLLDLLLRGDFFFESERLEDESRLSSFSINDSSNTLRLAGLIPSTRDLILERVAGEILPSAVKKSMLKFDSIILLLGETLFDGYWFGRGLLTLLPVD